MWEASASVASPGEREGLGEDTAVLGGLTRPAVSLVPSRRQIGGLGCSTEPGHRQHREHQHVCGHRWHHLCR